MKKVVIITILFLMFPLKVLSLEKETVTFSKCVDGDTAKFVYKGNVETFRFLAIDTPESTKEIEPFGKEASNYTCSKITNANNIQIEFDKNSDKKDKYDRYLVWIYVDNTLLNNEIVKNGYAEVAYLYGDYAYTDTLKESEKVAKEAKLNIWSDYEETDYTNYYVIALFVLILLFIFFKKYRSKIKKEIKKLLKKLIK